MSTKSPKVVNDESKTLMRAQELRIAFGGQVVLNGLNLELKCGEIVLLRGENGSGKTTLLNIITGNLQPDHGAISLFTNGYTELFEFPRKWWRNLNPWDHFTPERVAREGVGRTWQDIRLFPTQSLVDNIALASQQQMGENPLWAIFRRPSVTLCEQRNIEASEVLLRNVNLLDRKSSSADMVSLGQAKRAGIVRAVRAGARVLCLDEPLAGLDAEGVRDILSLLHELAQTESTTLIIIEHVLNAARILDIATTVWTFDHGRLLVETPAKVLDELKCSGHSTGIERISAVAGLRSCAEQCTLNGGALLTTFTSTDSPSYLSGSGEVMLEVKNLIVRRKGRIVLGAEDAQGKKAGISFALRDGQVAILQAPNGWGKTTLMEAISGLLPIEEGEVLIRGQPVHRLPPWERSRLGVSLLQSRDNHFPNFTVEEALRLSNCEKPPDSLNGFRHKHMSVLSGGERQKVALAAITAAHAPIRLFDEPFSALDGNALKDALDNIFSPDTKAALVAIPAAA